MTDPSEPPPPPPAAPPPLRAKVLTVSDGVFNQTREDTSGAALAERLEAAGWEVIERRIVRDGSDIVGDALREMSVLFNGLVVTTGGTGFGPRDQTPEGTAEMIQREAPGLAEAMRLASPLGRLSRARAGSRQQALIINTPGSTSGALECLEAVLDVLPHAVRLLAGEHLH